MAENTVVASAPPDENCFKIFEFMAPLKCDALCRLPPYTCTRDLIMVKIPKKNRFLPLVGLALFRTRDDDTMVNPLKEIATPTKRRKM